MNEYLRIHTKARKNAAARSIPFELSWEDMQALAREADGRCTVSGILFDFTRLDGMRRRPFGASLDRINSKLGYTKENCRLVCCAVNLALNEWGEGVFIYVAQQVAARAGRIAEMPSFPAAPKPNKATLPDKDALYAMRRESGLKWPVWHASAKETMLRQHKAQIAEAIWRGYRRAGKTPGDATEAIFQRGMEGKPALPV